MFLRQCRRRHEPHLPHIARDLGIVLREISHEEEEAARALQSLVGARRAYRYLFSQLGGVQL